MALSHLLRRLEEDAESRAATMLSAAHAEAGRLGADSAAELTRRRTQALAGREAEVRASAAREAAIARRVAATELLVARAAVLRRIFEGVDASLAERRATAAVQDCAAADLAAALGYLDGSGTARCRPELVDWLRGRLPADSAFTVEADPSAGIGAVLRAPDGSVEIDATVEHRLARLQAQLSVVAFRMLGRSDGAALG